MCYKMPYPVNIFLYVGEEEDEGEGGYKGKGDEGKGGENAVNGDKNGRFPLRNSHISTFIYGRVILG